MVRDGYFYALGCVVAGLLVGWLTALHWLALIPLLLAAFFLWFFRDPERTIPSTPGAIVSIADGKVTEIAPVLVDGVACTRISVFLNVFNVHVNRAPASGTVTKVEMREGQFKNAMAADSAELNEQSICTLRTDDGATIVFKQIAGLLARRIVFWPKIGDRLQRGQRFGLIKFGSRCDVIFPASANVSVRMGQHVSGGSTVLAVLPLERSSEPVLPRASESAR
jgi:phosphatidylserine decarboxylase